MIIIILMLIISHIFCYYCHCYYDEILLFLFMFSVFLLLLLLLLLFLSPSEFASLLQESGGAKRSSGDVTEVIPRKGNKRIIRGWIDPMQYQVCYRCSFSSSSISPLWM